MRSTTRLGLFLALAATAPVHAAAVRGAPPAPPAQPAAPAPPGSPAPAPAIKVERFSLANGIRAIVVEAPGATKQSMLMFLPQRLADDPAGKAQWSHLVEHLLLRSVVPEGFEIDGVRINGETRPMSQHLETVGDPATLDRMADLHAAWLRSRDVADGVLEAEKANIEQEESTTAARGFTSKFAIAAWNQVVRQGQRDARVHGNVAGATRDDAEAWLRNVAPIGPGLLVATIGPTSVAQARATLERTVGAAQAGAPPAALPPSQPRAVAPGETIEASWDMPRRHVMLWWDVPAATLVDRVRSQVVGTMIHLQVSADPALRNPGVVALVSPFLPPVGPSAGAPFATLLVDVSLKPDDTVDSATIVKAVRDAVTRLSAGIAGKDLEQQWRPKALLPALSMPAPPFRESQRRAGGAAFGDLLETQWLLTNGIAEFEFGATRDELAAAADAVDLASVRAFVAKLADEAPRVLVLKP